MTSSAPIRVLHVHEVDLRDDPIEPSWIIEGSPVARASGWATSYDGTASSFVWDCTAGRFHWYFAEDESVHIVEGAVTVSGEGVPPVILETGDAALFQAGTWAEWHVADYVRKHAILRAHLPWPIAFLTRVWRFVQRRVRVRSHPGASQPRAPRR